MFHHIDFACDLHRKNISSNMKKGRINSSIVSFPLFLGLTRTKCQPKPSGEHGAFRISPSYTLPLSLSINRESNRESCRSLSHTYAHGHTHMHAHDHHWVRCTFDQSPPLQATHLIHADIQNFASPIYI